jgi:hypothetical protein
MQLSQDKSGHDRTAALLATSPYWCPPCRRRQCTDRMAHFGIPDIVDVRQARCLRCVPLFAIDWLTPHQLLHLKWDDVFHNGTDLLTVGGAVTTLQRNRCGTPSFGNSFARYPSQRSFYANNA